MLSGVNRNGTGSDDDEVDFDITTTDTTDLDRTAQRMPISAPK